MLEQAQNVTTIALPVFAGLIVLELALSVWRQQRAYVWQDFLGSMSQLVGNIFVQLLTRGLILAFYFWLFQYRLFTVPLTLLGFLLTAILIDFQFYWFHRASHRIRILWAVHVSHHSSEHMNFGTALRQPWLGPLVKPIFYWPLPLLGFHPLAIMAVGGLLTIYGFWTHTEQIRSIGWLDRVFVSPAHHRVHHGSNPAYIDKNYANFLIIWDRLFGTFKAETEPVTYGLTRNIKSYNPLTIAFHEAAAIWREAAKGSRQRPLWQIVFGPPEAATPETVAAFGNNNPRPDPQPPGT